MAIAQTPDLSIHYEIRGEGPRVLFLGGSGGDLRHGPTIFDSPLAKRFTVLAFDQRGLGQTGRPTGPYTMANYADDAAALLDAVGWERAHFLGISFGGMVAQEFALRHGTRQGNAVWCCTSSGGAGGASYPLHTLAQLPQEEQARLRVRITDERVDDDFASREPERYAALLAAARDEQARAARDEVRAGLAPQLGARAGHDTFARLSSVEGPVFLAGGLFDGIAPPANMRALAGQIPNAQLRLYDGGHLFFQQDRRAFPAIMQFLAEGTMSREDDR
ncbi:MAG: alpha/beta fold hydrolase [Alphaproteobacteria bacterium]|nr:alpha/beta fold hydrolase [Alphaproteobacteria bacterium]